MRAAGSDILQDGLLRGDYAVTLSIPVWQFVRRLRYGRPIVVVSGLPRSGTSMMMQMLQAGGLEIVTDAVRTPDDEQPKGLSRARGGQGPRQGTPPAWLGGARGKAVKIVSSLVRWLPETNNYQVIFMQRNLDEVIASQNKMLIARGDAGRSPARTSTSGAVLRKHVEETLRLLRGRPSGLHAGGGLRARP